MRPLGFLSIYNQTDRVELGGGYYIDVKRFLSQAETARAEAVRMSKDIRSEMDEKTGNAKATVIQYDAQAYNVEILVAAIVDWNLDDEQGVSLQLPVYIPGKTTGEDLANRVRRESIGRLPEFAVKRVLEQIRANEKDGVDAESLAAFPGESTGAPAEA